MDKAKQAAFVKACGKKRLKLAKGGKVPRMYYAPGGPVQTQPVQTMTTMTGAGAPANMGAQEASAPLGGGNYLAAQNAYSANLAPQYQTNYSGLIQQGSNQIGSVYGGEQNLEGNLQNIANGTGPNPAQAELAQATGQNVNNQAALMAGQRGASGNVGLIARQAAQQGAATQQQAAGQAATMQAQQQIAADQNLQSLYNQEGQQGLGEVGQAGALQNTQNANNIQNYGMAQGINSQVSQQNANSVTQSTAGLFGALTGAGSAISSIFAKGGEVGAPENYYDGGQIANVPQIQINGPGKLDYGKVDFTSKKKEPAPGEMDNDSQIGEYLDADAALPSQGEKELPAANDGEILAAHGGQMYNPRHFHEYFAGGGNVDAMVSPGEIYLSPENVRKVVEEGKDPKAVGEHIKGKAKVKGDSYANDTVPKTLQEGGVVIDRKNVGTREKRELFVHRALAKKKAGGR